jgi:hypothetical protein
MRKNKLLCILFVCLFIVSACSANDLPIKRKTNRTDDVVKFYGLEWLTERSTIEKKFNEDFGSDYICKEDLAIVNDNIDAVNVLYKGKAETDLNWSVADHNVSELLLYYIKSKSGKYYLYRATWRFNNCNKEDEDFFNTKLDKLYPNTKKNSTIYTDKNENQISLSYIDSTKEIILDFCCYDILYQLSDKEKEFNNSKQESIK